MEPIKILIVDDHAIVRSGLTAWIKSEKDIVLIGEAANGQEAIEQALKLKPDVILMDLVMPIKGGVEAITEIISENSAARILVITSFSTREEALAAIKAGAMGFIQKDTSIEEMLNAILAVYENRPWLSPEVTRMLMRDGSHQEELKEGERLTVREIDVLKLIAQGFSDSEIASQLHISKATVRYHVTNILSKLHLENRTQAALYAIKKGHVSFPSP